MQRLVALGLSGLIQTSAIERVNLTIRQGVALLTRRTWSLAQSETHLHHHVCWWQAYHLARPHQALRLPVAGFKHRFFLRVICDPAGCACGLVGEIIPAP